LSAQQFQTPGFGQNCSFELKHQHRKLQFNIHIMGQCAQILS
jgi:hypothetical protein